MIKAFEETEICVSLPLLDEYRDVPRELFGTDRGDRERFKALISGIAAFVSMARVVFPRRALGLARDPGDNALLECCMEAGADVLVTLNRDLLNVAGIPSSLRIVGPRTFSMTV